MLKATGGSGLNGDSIPFVPKEFWDESVAQGHPLALQAEGDTNDPALNWSTLGWGYWGRQSNPGDAAGYRWSYGTVYVTCGPAFHHLGCFVLDGARGMHMYRVLAGFSCSRVALADVVLM